MNDLCPCGSKQNYIDCCGAIITGKREASTCLELMKSRYSAYVKADVNYLMLSLHSKKWPSKRERLSIKKWVESVRWMQLVIVNAWSGNSEDTEGHVEFKALYFENGQINQIHEKSLFQRENEKWVYVSGDQF